MCIQAPKSSIRALLENIPEVRVLKIGQVRAVSVLLVDLVAEGRGRFISLLVAVHEQHSQRNCQCHLGDRAS